MLALVLAALAAAPDGFIEMTVAGVAPTDQGHAVLLVDAGKTRFVPIFVGESEALAISLRSTHQPFERPLTHDLLDAILGKLGGKLGEVRIMSLREATFIATLTVKDGDVVHTFDARPSDAIALALGSNVPIWVSANLVKATAVPLDPKAKE